MFKNSKYDHYVSLYFSADKFSKIFNKFIERYNNEFDRLSNAIKNGDQDVAVSQDMKKYFSIIDNNGKKEIICNIEQLQLEIDKEGFLAVASNVEDSAEETYYIVKSRIYVEKGFMAFKSQLGYGSMHVHDINRIYGKFFVAFVSCVHQFTKCWKMKTNFKYSSLMKLKTVFTIAKTPFLW